MHSHLPATALATSPAKYYRSWAKEMARDYVKVEAALSHWYAFPKDESNQCNKCLPE